MASCNTNSTAQMLSRQMVAPFIARVKEYLLPPPPKRVQITYTHPTQEIIIELVFLWEKKKFKVYDNYSDATRYTGFTSIEQYAPRIEMAYMYHGGGKDMLDRGYPTPIPLNDRDILDLELDQDSPLELYQGGYGRHKHKTAERLRLTLSTAEDEYFQATLNKLFMPREVDDHGSDVEDHEAYLASHETNYDYRWHGSWKYLITDAFCVDMKTLRIQYPVHMSTNKWRVKITHLGY